MFVDPGAFASLPDVHQRLFRATDVLLSGAVLGGGSDALHQMVLVFTNYFEGAKGRVKGVGSRDCGKGWPISEPPRISPICVSNRAAATS